MNHTKKIFYRPHIIFQFVTESRLCIQVKFFEISLAVHFRWRLLSIWTKILERPLSMASTFDLMEQLFVCPLLNRCGLFNFELSTFRTSTSEPFTFKTVHFWSFTFQSSTCDAVRQNLIDRT